MSAEPFDPPHRAPLPGADALAELGYEGPLAAVPPSSSRFPDGGAYRVEIPSVEGPDALDAVLTEAATLGVPVHRISQGSGIMMLRDDEIAAMLQRAAEDDVEVCLFLGPRASWDTGAGRGVTGAGPRARGADHLGQAVADAQRAVELGLRCLLLADEGVLWTLHRLRANGELPADLRLKVSALAGPQNPAAFSVLASLGADSINVPGDLSVAHFAELRAVAASAIDVYVESPDDVGGYVQHYEAAEMVRVAAPIYLKFGVRNAPPLYPCGQHLADVAVRTGRERVRRARLCLDQLERTGVAGVMSPRAGRVLPAATRFPVPATETVT